MYNPMTKKGYISTRAVRNIVRFLEAMGLQETIVLRFSPLIHFDTIAKVWFIEIKHER